MDTHFLKLLVCPLCNSPLRHDQNEQELVCQYDKLAYPIRNGIPIMLQEEARSLSQNHGAAAAARQVNSKAAENNAAGSATPSTPNSTH